MSKDEWSALLEDMKTCSWDIATEKYRGGFDAVPALSSLFSAATGGSGAQGSGTGAASSNVALFVDPEAMTRTEWLKIEKAIGFLSNLDRDLSKVNAVLTDEFADKPRAQPLIKDLEDSLTFVCICVCRACLVWRLCDCRMCV